MNKQGESSTMLSFQRSEMEKRMRDIASAVITNLRQERQLCDVVIKVGGTQFDAHKIILCGCSMYFRTLFTGAWATSNKIYTIPGVSAEMMQFIINYAYTHFVPVTEDNVVMVLAAADQFLIPGIIQTCCFFLEERLCLMNCIGIWRLVDFYHCPDLRHKVFLYILHHFEEIDSVSEELLDLPVEQLAAIIENDRLNVKQEITPFEVILRWINHLPEQRQGYISVLLPKVRLGLMTVGDLHHRVLNNAVIRDNIECIPFINDMVELYLAFRGNRHSKHFYSNPLTRPRMPSAILLVTGGKEGIVAATSLEAYDARADCWVTLNTEETVRAHHGAVVHNNIVYLIGGCSSDEHLNTVLTFDLVTCTWRQVASMKFRRCYVSVAVLNGCIYAMGGFNGQAYYNTVECYKPETGQWTMTAPMHSKRSGASSTTLNGKVYICGGFNGRRSMSTAECYNPNANQWTRISPMTSCRSGLGVTVYKDRIYAVGGTFNETFNLCSAEAYDLRTNRWRPIPPMLCPRSYFGIEVVDDKLFVVGGYDGSSTMLTVEYYDEEIGLWSNASCIETSRSGLSCSVLHGLYSVAEKLFPRGPLALPKMNETAGEGHI